MKLRGKDIRRYIKLANERGGKVEDLGQTPESLEKKLKRADKSQPKTLCQGITLRQPRIIELSPVKPIDTKEIAAKKIGQNIAYLIRYIPLSQFELADLAGLPASQISDFLKGKRPNISWYVIYKIIQSLGISFNDILDAQFELDALRKRFENDEPLVLSRMLFIPRSKVLKISQEDRSKLKAAISRLLNFEGSQKRYNELFDNYIEIAGRPGQSRAGRE